jgi:hypothetical protein
MAVVEPGEDNPARHENRLKSPEFTAIRFNNTQNTSINFSLCY